MNIDGDDATPGLPPKGALEEAVALFDELRALVAQEEIRIPHMAADCNREHTKIADLDSRRAALEPRLAKRRENQAKPPRRQAVSRIVNTDNFGGDYPNESFVLWPMKRESAQLIADVLNIEAGEHASRFFKVVPNDYKLQPGFEP